MAYKNLLCEIREATALITVNRPKKLNALNGETSRALAACFRDLEDDPGVRAVILTGAGRKAFVAGADIGDLEKLDALSGRRFGLLGQQIFSQIENMSKPVIAAINGYALGGGLELAMACHIRIASGNAKLGQPEVKIGVIPGNGGSQRLPRLVGKGRAIELILTGEPVTAEEAWRIGLVNRVVSFEELLPAARTMAKKILANSPVAVTLALQAVNHGLEMPLEKALQWEASQLGLACGSADFREGVRAFLEKRPPDFKGC